MKRWFLLFAAMLFIFACSQSDDGPISIYPEDFNINGYGYVLFAELDSGNRFHLENDSIVMFLDSMWTFGNCFLKRIELYEEFPSDTIAKITVKLALGNTGTTDCPQPTFRPDTTLRIAYPADWKDHPVRQLLIEGNAHNEFYTGSLDTSQKANYTIKDSIWVRRGKFVSESVSVYVDSLFSNPYKLPRRTHNDTAGVLKVVDSTRIDTFSYRLIQSKCIEIHDTCETIADTIWKRSWSSFDTNLVEIRLVCKNDTAGDSLIYCLSANWEIDSTKIGDSVYNYMDTTWYTSSYFVEKIPDCASMNRVDAQSGVTVGRYFTSQHVLFVPGESENSCGPAALKHWYIYSVGTKEEVLDSLKADSLHIAWENASIGENEEKEDDN